ncbi:hypothetical protein ACLOJK_012234 [Asimina triloba]
MESPPNENSKTMIAAQRGKELVQELLKGRNITAELGLLLKKPPTDQDLELAKSLAEKVGLCFSNAFSIIESEAAGDGGRNPSDALLESLHFGDRGIKDSGEKKKIPATKDRRGCYKRRRTSEMEATLTANPFNDGHSWRKYGQKDILGSIYPRCTHKHDQHCQAIKQVQQTEENPSMYRVTYMGQHTCRDPLKASQLVMDASSPKEPFMLRFESRSAQCNSMLFSMEPIKQEINEDMPSDLTQMSSPSSGYIFPSDIPTIGSCGPLRAFSMAGSDLTGDVASAGGYSCSSPSFSIMDTANFTADFTVDFDAFLEGPEFS